MIEILLFSLATLLLLGGFPAPQKERCDCESCWYVTRPEPCLRTRHRSSRMPLVIDFMTNCPSRVKVFMMSPPLFEQIGPDFGEIAQSDPYAPRLRQLLGKWSEAGSLPNQEARDAAYAALVEEVAK